ncbi:methylamine utilization protein [Aliidiomarina iranensis]|uniref:methylamine utilization protein n=1 Tax=Aliidiomarina iranensis TaxID=1434071 RepID=UPI000F88D95B|nr:methylamine utilization protein [Aliidiomarina iranensis]
MNKRIYFFALVVLVSSSLVLPLKALADEADANLASETLFFIDADEKPLAGVILFQIANANGDATVNPASNPASNPSGPIKEPTEHIMDQVSRQFLPKVLIVSKGDSVSFPNSDSIRHHVYSFSSARSFDIELYGNSEIPTLDFPRSGLVVVGCNIHDEMIGYIIVSEGAVTLQSDAEGRIVLTTDIENAEEWVAWHPWMSAAGFAPVPLEDIARNIPTQFSVRAPAVREESDLESRFRRRLNRGN